MRTFKYVVVSEAYPYIFTEASTHGEFKHKNVTSAGMASMSIENGKVKIYTFGKSTSLGLEPKEGDADMLKRVLVDPFWDE